MLEEYKKHEKERLSQGIPPLALNTQQVADLVELIKKPPAGEEKLILDLLTNRIPAGVDQAAYIKAAFLSDIANSDTLTPLISPDSATRLLGTMLGGYNIQPLINLLHNEEIGDIAVEALSNTLLIFDAFHDIFELSKSNKRAKKVITSWAEAEWFLKKPQIAFICNTTNKHIETAITCAKNGLHLLNTFLPSSLDCITTSCPSGFVSLAITVDIPRYRTNIVNRNFIIISPF